MKETQSSDGDGCFIWIVAIAALFIAEQANRRVTTLEERLVAAGVIESESTEAHND